MKTLIAFLVTCTIILVTGCASPHQATQWEYKSIQTHLSQGIDAKLNDLAKEGWIVVSSSMSQNENSTPYILVILKRQK